MAACAGASAQVSQRDTAFVNVNVVPMDRERVLERQTVIVRDGRIAAMGPASSSAVPAGAATIDGTGKYLIPGLAEMHAHFGGAPPPNAGGEEMLLLYLANGVTVVRTMAAGPAQLVWREQLARGTILGPDLLVASPAITGRTRTPEEAASSVRQWAAQGFDIIKFREGPSVEVFDAAARAAHDAGVPWGGHVSDLVGLRHTLAARPATLEHLDNYVEDLVPPHLMTRKPRLGEEAALYTGEIVDKVDLKRLPEVVRLTKASGTYLAPSMVLWEVYLAGKSGARLAAEHPETRYVSPREVTSWIDTFDKNEPMWPADPVVNQKALALRQTVLRALHKGGVPMILAADTPGVFSVPGFATHEELAYLVHKGGFTPYQALETGTRRVAEYLKRTSDFGTVAVGQRANLVLLNANPLSRIEHTSQRAGVMIHGRWLPDSELQTRLAAIAARHGQAAPRGGSASQ